MKLKLKKERNPYVEQMKTRKSGAHGKTKKAIRRKEKVEFKKKYGSVAELV